MSSKDASEMKFALEESWYKEYGTFLMVPAFATLACCFIPLFHCEQGLNNMTILPLSGCCSFGQMLAPRRIYYENNWQKLMDYSSYVLANLKKVLLFGIPTGLSACIASLFLSGYSKELTMVFEISAWSLMGSVCLFAMMGCFDQKSKLRMTNNDEDKAKLANLWRWVIPSVIISSILAISRIWVFLKIIEGRS